MLVKEINVCSNANWNADSNETITFKNTHTQAVTVRTGRDCSMAFHDSQSFHCASDGQRTRRPGRDIDPESKLSDSD